MRKVTAIMLARDNLSHTLAAVRALVPELLAIGGSLVLVDQGSTDPIAGHVAEAVGDEVPLHVIHNLRNETYAVAANAAARDAESDFLLFLDNDAILHPGSLARMLAAFDLDARIAAVGPKMLYPSGQIQEAGLALPLWLVPIGVGTNASGTDHRFNFPRNAFAVSSSCMIVRRPAFEAVAGFDIGYVWGFESTDLALAFRQRSWLVQYEPRAVCTHEGAATLRHFPALTPTDANRRRLLERWGIKLLRQVATYLDTLSAGGPRSFMIYGTGECGQHLANTLEIGGYEVAGFLAGANANSVGRYPAWNVADAPLQASSRVLIGSPYVREAEDVLAHAGLLAGAALPILLE